jgi:5-methylcytosine-specific restriction endonuclease McrA
MTKLFWGINSYFTLCDICGNQVVGGRFKRGYHTCSPECNKKKWDNWSKIIIEEEKNATGIRPKLFWQSISRECLVRDGWTCQKCGITQDQLIKRGVDNMLHCHHKRQIKDGGSNKLENLITLCPQCHKEEHSRIGKIKRMHRQLVFK